MKQIIEHIQSYIEMLVSFGGRQGVQETKAAEWIQSVLLEHNVPFSIQTFDTSIPDVLKEELIVDGEHMDCKATCFVSGKILDNHSLVSSLIGTQPLIDQPNINFNPLCKSISRGNHYFAPSVAVRASDVARIIKAKDIRVVIEIEKTPHTSQNILIGNVKNPDNVLVCHYDSIGPGATDNASGTAMLMALAIHNPEILDRALFLIGGNEEVSYDYPLYWGHGYRAFEDVYPHVFARASQIFVVDCVGDGPVTFDNDIDTVRLGFPVTHLKEYIEKTSLVYGSFDALLQVYQSDIDVPEVLDKKYLEETYMSLLDTVH